MLPRGGVSSRRPAGSRRVGVYARRGARGGEEGRFPPCGAGSTCLRTDGGSLCSEETLAAEGGCETERPVSGPLALFIFLLTSRLLPLTPPSPKRRQTAATTAAARRGRPRRTERAGQEAHPGWPPARRGHRHSCFRETYQCIAEGKPSFGVLRIKAHKHCSDLFNTGRAPLGARRVLGLDCMPDQPRPSLYSSSVQSNALTSKIYTP